MRSLRPGALTATMPTGVRIVASVVLMAAGVALTGVIWAPAGIGSAVLGALLLPLPEREGATRRTRSRSRSR